MRKGRQIGLPIIESVFFGGGRIYIKSPAERKSLLKPLNELKVKFFADGADKVGMLECTRTLGLEDLGLTQISF